jgi:AcrR family transcriptional regulator
VEASTQEHRERGTEVLEAAKELFFEKGYRSTTIQQIAERAGYSKRTVYLDYRNKDELFGNVCAQGGQLLLGLLEKVPGATLPVEACLQAYLRVLIDFSRDHRQYFRMIFSESTKEIVDNCSEELRDRLATAERACLEVIVKLAERATREGHIPAIDPWDTAGIFIGTATGIILLSTGGIQTVFSQTNLESLANQAIWTFWHGLRAAHQTESLAPPSPALEPTPQPRRSSLAPPSPEFERASQPPSSSDDKES